MVESAGTTVEVELQEGMMFKVLGEDGIAVALDSSPEHGGKNAGLRPMELLLASLGGCTGMDVLSILRNKKQNVTAYMVEVSGVQADKPPRVFTEISIRHIVEGDVGEDAVKRAIELSESKYCPAYAMLRQVATISTAFEVYRQG